MKAGEYWQARGVQNLKKADRYAQRQAELVTRWFRRAEREMTARINDYYKKYAGENGISKAEAVKQVNDPAVVRKTLDDYYALIRRQDDPSVRNTLKKIGLARAVSREEFLKMQLNIIATELYQDYHGLTAGTLTKVFEDTYYKTIFDHQQFVGYGAGFNRLSTNAIAAAVSTNWSGKNYSARIWGSQRVSLARRLNRVITTGIIEGRPNREMCQDIQKEMETSAYNARRLIRTEANYVFGEANFRAYQQNGTQRYKFLAVLDLHTSSRCRELDGRVFQVSQRKVGVNCNPMHPFCRSTTVPEWPDEEFDSMETRSARGHDGSVYKVPASMDYKVWHDKYVKNVPGAELRERQLKNIHADGLQFDKYRGLLGKDAPKNLEEYQKMKYTDPDGWEDLKAFARYKRKYPDSDRRYYEINKKIQNLREKGLVDRRIGIAVKPQYQRAQGYGGHALKRMFERGFGTEDADGYIKNAEIAFSQFKGTRITYFSESGASTILNSSKEIITGWSKDDFDESYDRILEVLKHVK